MNICFHQSSSSHEVLWTDMNPFWKDAMRSPCGVMAKVLDCSRKVSEFEFWSCYYVHFRTNNLVKNMNPLVLPAMGLIKYHCSSKMTALTVKNEETNQLKAASYCNHLNKEDCISPNYIVIRSRHQHRYPWPFLTTPLYRPSLLVGLQGYILYWHRAVVCRF